ncbi:uncharacterized protein LOC142150829 [Mixophyes fleayi]|uniref:uncharacterized protein LOC142150829 n=1 Tax=Mixophyes fleayi TaxID=3061075 RepID=UPI003F4D91E6
MQHMLWYINFLFFYIIVSIIPPNCVEIVPLGADLTIKCSTREADFTHFPRKENVREFIYEETLYIMISDITHGNEGSYKCPFKHLIVKITEQSMAKEILKFRLVGETFMLFFKCAERRQVKWTSLSGRTGSITIISSIVYMNENFKNRVKSADRIHFMTLSISPVAFEDAGKYIPDFGFHINLVTIQVKAFPTTEVYPGCRVQLSCSVSHVLANMHVELIWIKLSGYSSVHVKTQKLKLGTVENSLWIEDLKEEEITKWTCLVFNENNLVALAPITLKYITSSKSDITTSINVYTAMTTGYIDEKATNGIIIVNVLVVCLIFIILTLVIVLALERMETSDAKNTEVQINEPLPEEIQYASVRFIKEQRGAKYTAVETIEHLPEETEYASVGLTNEQRGK